MFKFELSIYHSRNFYGGPDWSYKLRRDWWFLLGKAVVLRLTWRWPALFLLLVMVKEWPSIRCHTAPDKSKNHRIEQICKVTSVPYRYHFLMTFPHIKHWASLVKERYPYGAGDLVGGTSHVKMWRQRDNELCPEIMALFQCTRSQWMQLQLLNRWDSIKKQKNKNNLGLS